MFRTIPLLLLAASILMTGCVAVKPPTDTGSGNAGLTGLTAPSAPSQTGVVAYNPDLKALFASDCLMCHGGGRADGNYRMDTYAQVMAAVRPGSASSALVVTTQPSGRMYRYFSGSTATRQAKAAEVLSWVVTYKAQENR